MKKISFIITLLVVLIPLKINALTGNISIKCPRTEIAPTDIMNCAIIGSTTDPISSLSFKVVVTDNIRIVSTLPSAIWEGDGENDSFQLYTDTNKKDEFEIGMITIMGNMEGDSTITLADAKFYDENFNEVEIPTEEVSITLNPEIVSSDSPIESDIKITLMQKEKKEKTNNLHLILPIIMIVIFILIALTIYLLMKRKNKKAIEIKEEK